MLDYLNTYEGAKFSLKRMANDDDVRSSEGGSTVCSEGKEGECFAIIVGSSFAFFAIMLGVIWAGHVWYARKRDILVNKSNRFAANAQDENSSASPGHVSPEQLLEDVVNSQPMTNVNNTSTSQERQVSSNSNRIDSHFEVIETVI